MPSAAPTAHYDGQDLEALSDLPRYTNWILEQFSPWLRGRVLEVGAGIGNVAQHYIGRVDEAVLVEPAQNLYARLQQRVSAHGQVTTACGLLHEVAPQLAGRPFDAAVMVNVLEHIEDDGAVLRQLYELVRPGGAVLLFVPAMPWLYGSLDELVHHVRRYTRPQLQAALAQSGWQIERLYYCDVLGIAPWWLAGRVLRRRRFDAAAATWYDRLGVPLTRAVETWVEPPVGKSLVAIATRPLHT